jgi:hypothetical protein
MARKSSKSQSSFEIRNEVFWYTSVALKIVQVWSSIDLVIISIFKSLDDGNSNFLRNFLSTPHSCTMPPPQNEINISTDAPWKAEVVYDF